MGIWFVAPVTGTIDTIFWIMGDSVGAKDSTGYHRIHNSKITTSYGPGVNFDPPPTPWGHFINTNDQDRGIAAFPDDATPVGLSSWTSTIPSGPETQPPFLESCCGWGFGITLHAGRINALTLLDGGSNLDITAGQNFFLSFRIKGSDVHVDDLPTQFRASHSKIPYPSHSWTFFEHDSVLNPGAVKGWWAVGGPNFNIWYSMVVNRSTFDVPITSGWNLLSRTTDSLDGSVRTNFPTATSMAFAYASGKYEIRPTMNYGAGYWIKFSSTSVRQLSGALSETDTVDVSRGWNLIGPRAGPITASWISSIPAGIVTSNFWGYDSAYRVATSLYPGRGYWVKVNQSGKLILMAMGGASNPMSKISIQTTDELPPPPPDAQIPNPTSRIPNLFGLSQNYPNPFNPSTEIKYQLADRSQVRVRIYNTLGEVVATLVDKVQDAGYQSVRWDASSFPSGIYFYELRTDKFVETRKLIIMR